jgi:hypothetical protein
MNDLARSPVILPRAPVELLLGDAGERLVDDRGWCPWMKYRARDPGAPFEVEVEARRGAESAIDQPGGSIMTRFEVDFETKLSPERVVEALTDFSPRRPEVWTGLSREFYQVYSVAEHSAEVQEGSSKPIKVWAKERYDWSTPGTVTWTVNESNFCTPGSAVSVRAQASPAGGGSQIHLTWERFPSNLKGRVAIAMMKVMGPRIIKNYCLKVLDGLAETKPAG